MDASIIAAVISTAGFVGVSWVGSNQYKERVANEKRKCEIDKRDALKQEGILIQMEMTQAALKLSTVNAKAVMQQKLNGDIEDAMIWVREVTIKYNDYLRRLSISKTS